MKSIGKKTYRNYTNIWKLNNIQHTSKSQKKLGEKSMKMRGQLAKIFGTQKLRTKLIAMSAMIKSKSGKLN